MFFSPPTVAMVARTRFSVTLYIACRTLCLRMHCHVACVRVKYFSNVTAELGDVAIFCNCCLTECVWHKICRYVYEKSTCRIARGWLQRYVSLPHSNRRRKIFSHCSHVVILIFLEELRISRSVHIHYCILSPTSHICA